MAYPLSLLHRKYIGPKHVPKIIIILLGHEHAFVATEIRSCCCWHRPLKTKSKKKFFVEKEEKRDKRRDHGLSPEMRVEKC